MANVSYNMTIATLEGHELEPDRITVAANAPTTDVEVRFNTANIKTTLLAVRALKAFIRRLEDGRLGPKDFASI